MRRPETLGHCSFTNQLAKHSCHVANVIWGRSGKSKHYNDFFSSYPPMICFPACGRAGEPWAWQGQVRRDGTLHMIVCSGWAGEELLLARSSRRQADSAGKGWHRYIQGHLHRQWRWAQVPPTPRRAKRKCTFCYCAFQRCPPWNHSAFAAAGSQYCLCGFNLQQGLVVMPVIPIRSTILCSVSNPAPQTTRRQALVSRTSSRPSLYPDWLPNLPKSSTVSAIMR